jgi:hypothetical protein
VANPVARQGAARWDDHRRDGRHPGDARQWADAVGIEIGGGEDTTHVGHRAGDRGIDAFYRRMSVRRAQHDGVQLAGHIDVVDIATLPGQKPTIFEAGSANARYGLPSFGCAAVGVAVGKVQGQPSTPSRAMSGVSEGARDLLISTGKPGQAACARARWLAGILTGLGVGLLTLLT